MFKTRDIRAIFSRYEVECPCRGIKSLDGEVDAPSIVDVMTLHIPLGEGTAIHDEVRSRFAPGMDKIHEHVQAESTRGSQQEVISRKGWGDQTVFLYENPEYEGRVALKMVGAVVKGKPTIHYFPDVEPVLSIKLRGTLDTETTRPVADLIRSFIHQPMFVSITATQPDLPLDGEQKSLLSTPVVRREKKREDPENMELDLDELEPEEDDDYELGDLKPEDDDGLGDLPDDDEGGEDEEEDAADDDEGLQFFGGPECRAAKAVAGMNAIHGDFGGRVAELAAKQGKRTITMTLVEAAAKYAGQSFQADLKAVLSRL